MDSNFGEWYRLVNIEPTSDTLNDRWSGVEAFTEDIEWDDILDLARVFYRMKPNNDNFEEAFREAFQEIDSSFRMKDNDLELSVLAGASLACVFKGGSNLIAKLAAYASVCPDFQGSYKRAAVHDITVEARSSIRKWASANRKKLLKYVPPIGKMEQLSTILATNDPAQIGPVLQEHLASLGATVTGIREKLILFREDSDVLWWLMGEHSRDLELPITEIGLPTAGLVVGKELADMVRILPGPFAAQAVLHKMIDNATNGTMEDTELSEAVNCTSREWRTSWLEDLPTNSAFDLCPVLFAVDASLKVKQNTEWYPQFSTAFGVEATLKASPLDIATQAYDESLFFRVAANLMDTE